MAQGGGTDAPASPAKNQDFWLWTTFSIEKKLTEKITMVVDEEIRFRDNVSRLDLTYTNLGFGYKVNDHFKTALIYRFLQKENADGSTSFRHRIMWDVIAKTKISMVTMSYRSRLQSQIRDVYSSPDGRNPEKYWRNKFEFKFDLDKPITPYIAMEFRYQFSNDRLKEANNNWNRGRYFIGADYKINDGHTVGAYYMIQKNYNVIDPETDFTLGFTYSLDLDFLLGKSNEKKILRQ